MRSGAGVAAALLLGAFAGPACAAAPAYLRLPAAPAVADGLRVACIVEADAVACAPAVVQFGQPDGAPGALHLWLNNRLLSCTPQQEASVSVPGLRARSSYILRLYRSDASCAQVEASPQPAKGSALAVLQLSPVVRPRAGIGGNHFSLVPAYLGWRPTGTGIETDLPEAERRLALARVALDDAQTAGLSFLRFPVLGYGAHEPVTDAARVATDLDLVGLWYAQRGRYWSAVQAVFDDLHARDLRAVPSINWTIDQFVVLANNDAIRQGGALETTRDFILRTDSRAYGLFKTYIGELTRGYADANGSFVGAARHPALHFYEYGNETNNQVDLDRNRRCQDGNWFAEDVAARCDFVRNFSSAELVRHYYRAVRELKLRDPWHFVASGHSLPRASAEHLRACPEWTAAESCPESRWTNDTEAELIRNLVQLNRAFDLVSVHYYPRNDGSQDRFCGNTCSGPMGAALIGRLLRRIAATNKDLFIGEFGDFNVTARQAPGASFSENVLEQISLGQIRYAALWLWQDNVHASYAAYGMAWDLARTPLSVRQLRDTNTALGRAAPAEVPSAATDTVPPSLHLAWPRENDAILGPTMIHASATDDSLAPPRVEAFVDGVSLGSRPGPVYRWPLLPAQLRPDGGSELSLVACDAALAPNCTTQQIHLRLPQRPVITGTDSAGVFGDTIVISGRSITNDSGMVVELFDIDGRDPAARTADAAFSCTSVGVSCTTAQSTQRIEISLRSAALLSDLPERFGRNGFFVRLKKTAGGVTRYSAYATARKRGASEWTPVIDYASYGTELCRGIGRAWYWYCVELGVRAVAADALVEVLIAGPAPILIGAFPARGLPGTYGKQVLRFDLGQDATGLYERLFDTGSLAFRIVNPSDGAAGRKSAVVTVE